MYRKILGIFALLAIVLLPGGHAHGVTRDIADLQTAPLTLRRSVISQLTDGVIKDPYDEFLNRPYNLGFANIERLANTSPWPGQQGEQTRYVDFLIGNNGNSNVRNGADTLQGTFLGQPKGKLAWGISAAVLSDDVQNSDAAAGSAFSDSEQLSGADTRLAFGYRVSNRMVLGGGFSTYGRRDQVQDSGFTPGAGGFFSLQELEESGMEADFGMRIFAAEANSWDAKLKVGMGDTQLNDFSEILDDTGAVTTRFVVGDYEVSDQYVQLSGGYNSRYVESNGEMQVEIGIRHTTQELTNTNLSFSDTGGVVTPSLVLLNQDPVTGNEVFATADTLFVRGWTQIFGAARLSHSMTDGSTTVDSLGTIVNEAIDDSETRLALVMGLRQPLWSEKFRLVARARADWTNESRETVFDIASTGTQTTQTTTAYAIGVETVLNNMAFDIAWLFGGEPAPGGADEPSRQVIDLDRLVVSATFGW